MDTTHRFSDPDGQLMPGAHPGSVDEVIQTHIEGLPPRPTADAGPQLLGKLGHHQTCGTAETGHGWWSRLEVAPPNRHDTATQCDMTETCGAVVWAIATKVGILAVFWSF